MRLGNKHRAADDAARLQIVDRLIGPLEAPGLDRMGASLPPVTSAKRSCNSGRVPTNDPTMLLARNGSKGREIEMAPPYRPTIR